MRILEVGRWSRVFILAITAGCWSGLSAWLTATHRVPMAVLAALVGLITVLLTADAIVWAIRCSARKHSPDPAASSVSSDNAAYWQAQRQREADPDVR